MATIKTFEVKYRKTGKETFEVVKDTEKETEKQTLEDFTANDVLRYATDIGNFNRDEMEIAKAALLNEGDQCTIQFKKLIE